MNVAVNSQLRFSLYSAAPMEAMRKSRALAHLCIAHRREAGPWKFANIIAAAQLIAAKLVREVRLPRLLFSLKSIK